MKLGQEICTIGWPGKDKEFIDSFTTLSPLCASVELSYCSRKVFRRAPEITYFWANCP